MAKITLESLVKELNPSKKEQPAAEAVAGTINKLRTEEDSVVNRTRQKLSLGEALQLGRALTDSFSDDPEAAKAQGSGLTEERVADLLSDD